MSCNTAKKNFVCGERPCIDKKEFNEYFEKNLSIEVSFNKKNDNSTIDLAKLNTNSLNIKKDNKLSTKQKLKIKKKKEKERLKAEKIKLLAERKIKKNEKKLRLKNEKDRAKNDKLVAKKEIIKKKKSIFNKKKIMNNTPEVASKTKDRKLIEINNNKKSDVKNGIDSVTSVNAKSICDQIQDCDIDKIAEILIKKGKNKPFPNIASN